MTSVLFIGGIQLISIGMIGEYIGRIYTETKHRPNWIVNRSRNLGAVPPPRRAVPAGEGSGDQPSG
jgi:hypothetical protein